MGYTLLLILHSWSLYTLPPILPLTSHETLAEVEEREAQSSVREGVREGEGEGEGEGGEEKEGETDFTPVGRDGRTDGHSQSILNPVL